MSLSGKINVVNRKGETVPLHLETISNRLDELAAMSPPLNISTNKIASKTADRLIDGIKTSEIDVISAEICSKLIIDDDEFDTLAARIIVSDLHKNTYEDLRKYAKSLESYNYRDRTIKILHPKAIAYILMNHKELNEYIEYKQDYNFNYFGIITLINSYLLAYKFDNNIRIVKERPQQLLLRVAIGIHLDEIEDNGHASKGTHESIRETYKLLAYKYYTHATPTLFNAGTINHTLSSCYLLAIDDSLESIYGRLTDIAKISKFSGGVGIHVSQVRAEGSVIGSTIGRSEGLVPMLRVYNESTRYVSQGGGKRKGSTAVYVEPWHADIEACIASQQQQNGGSPEKLCRDLFLALWIPDIFMERLRSSIKSGNTIMWSLMCPDECKGLTDVYGEEFKQLYETYEKQKKYKKQIPIIYLWNLIASSQIETGKPYVMYKDHVNRKCNQNNLGTIKSSNLCVAGDTLLLTKDGYKEIDTLVDQTVEIWDTEKFIEAPVFKTGENQKLLKITTSDGCFLECTEYHRFSVMVSDSYFKYSKTVKEAKDLKEGDKLFKSKYPVIDGSSNDMLYPYTHGFYCGDGTNYIYSDGQRKMPVIDLYHEKHLLEEHIEFIRKGTKNEKSNKTRYVLNDDIAEKFEVPSTNSSLKCKLLWLSGLLDADGCLVHCSKLTNTQAIQMASIHKEFLINVKLLCNTLGCNPKVAFHRTACNRMMPDNKGLGEMKEYKCKETHRLLFTAIDTYKLYELGLQTYRLEYNFVKPLTQSRRYATVKSIETVEGTHDTYCAKSVDTEMVIFNGLATFNCSEICIYSDEKNVGVCNLASICLPKFVVTTKDGEHGFDYNKLNQITQRVVYNMNKVIDNNKYPIEQAKYSDDMNRPIGIGVQGLSEVFMMMKQPFDSPIARDVNAKIFETMYYAAMTASNKLAQAFGSYPNFKGSMTSQGIFQYDLWDGVVLSKMWDWDELKHKVKRTGLRNSLLMCIMPTAGTSIITGHTESVEVLKSNFFKRSSLSGNNFQVINKHLVQDLKKLNLWNVTIRNKILENEGSVAMIEEIPKKLRDVYKTIYEYKLSAFIEMCADREAFVCQSSSNNRFVSDPSVSKLTKMHLYSWKMGLKTSSYYVHPKQVSTGKKLLKKDSEEEEVCLSCTA